MTTNLAGRVVAGLKERILSGELVTGARLPSESALIEEYGVSRTVVREAVTRLRAEGFVETFQGRGSFVLALPEPTSFQVGAATVRSRRDLLHVIDFRLGMECEAAALAALNLTEPAGEEVRAAMAAFATVSPAGVVEADFAFHRAVAAASQNRFYLELLESLGPMMIMLPRTQLADEYSMTNATHVERVRSEHDAITSAVLARDPDTARAAMRVHLGNTRRRLES